METGKAINRLSNRLRRRSQAVQAAIGLSGARGNLLDYILIESEHRSVYQKDLEEEFDLRPSTATGALKALEEQGLIRREQEAQDGRWKRIVFTDRAKEIEDVLREQIRQSEALLLEGITEQERQEFLRIAEKMLQNLDGAAAQSRRNRDK